MKKITKTNTKPTKTQPPTKPTKKPITKSIKTPKPAKTNGKKIRYKTAEVVQKDIPLHNLIDQVAVIYLKEMIMNYQAAFKENDSYSRAIRDSGTRSLHGEFYDGCKRYSALNDSLKSMQKTEDASIAMAEKTAEVLQQAEIIFAQIRESNLEQLEKLEQLALVMRSGQAWRKELDAVGLGKNANRWLKFWDENFPKIKALKAKRQ